MEAILSVAFLLSSASFLISSATTANPFPASPALAASIAAFRANRFVCSAIELIVSTIDQIFLALFLIIQEQPFSFSCACLGLFDHINNIVNSRYPDPQLLLHDLLFG